KQMAFARALAIAPATWNKPHRDPPRSRTWRNLLPMQVRRRSYRFRHRQSREASHNSRVAREWHKVGIRPSRLDRLDAHRLVAWQDAQRAQWRIRVESPKRASPCFQHASTSKSRLGRAQSEITSRSGFPAWLRSEGCWPFSF